MFTFLPSFGAVRQSVLVATVASSAVIAGAQTAPATNPIDSTDSVHFQTAATPKLQPAPEPLFSSSLDSSSAQDAGTAAATMNMALLEKAINLSGANMQYGRRRYGAPRYRGGNTNADGSEKYTAFGGVGFTAPVGSDSNYLTTSYAFQVGAGRNFNKRVGVNLQFDWDKFGFTGSTINNQNNVYQFLYANSLPPVDGNSKIWSFTLNPTYYIKSGGDGLGAYVVVGGGFYHKTATFFVQEPVTAYSYYYGYYQYAANVPIDDYTSNSAGVNGGIGFTYKFSHFSNERLYGEARVVHTFNSYRTGATITTDASGNIYTTNNNFFPQNSQTTTYIPVKFGIRF